MPATASHTAHYNVMHAHPEYVLIVLAVFMLLVAAQVFLVRRLGDEA